MIPKDVAVGSRLWFVGDDLVDVVEAVLEWRHATYLTVTYPEGSGRYDGLSLERSFLTKREALIDLRERIENERKAIGARDRALYHRANEVLERIFALDRAERGATA